MISGFVHHIEIGLGGQHDHQRDPFYFAARKIFHLHRRIQMERSYQLVDSDLIFGKMFWRQMLCPFQRVLVNLLNDSELRVEQIFLFQESYPYVLQKQHFAARVGAVLASDYAQQASLPSAIRSD